ncbi:hypothetical protein [Streptomyces sp. NBRC 110035]|uniref:hypothetical protein n=1 Tax=Streptomyces sp. NBRC 110035 TaxID=1547867 RepID=UPI00099D6BEA|nr:hypothetical protein [Streptomyces sp. NBRC 110035]
MISITHVAAAPTVWMATSEGLVCLDLIAIERAANGGREGWTLTEDEAWYAASLLFERGVLYSVIARRLGINSAKIRAWFPDLAVPADECMSRTGTRKMPAGRTPVCGTRKGYGRHHRRGEAPCQPCKDANAVADRYYRKHGTYIGAPEVAA